jgi:hypothetical protein
MVHDVAVGAVEQQPEALGSRALLVRRQSLHSPRGFKRLAGRNRNEEFLLARKVVVERGLRHADLARQVAHRRRRKSLVAKQQSGLVENLINPARPFASRSWLRGTRFRFSGVADAGHLFDEFFIARGV